MTKTDDNFFHRTKALHNQMIRKYKIYGHYLNKDRLLKIYWNCFNRFFTPDSNCTWRILCRCGSCNPMSKLITGCINRVKTRGPNPKPYSTTTTTTTTKWGKILYYYWTTENCVYSVSDAPSVGVECPPPIMQFSSKIVYKRT